MRRTLMLGLTLLPVAWSSAEAGYVKGYTRKDGTYVAPYYRGGPSTSSPSYTPVYTPPSPTTYPIGFTGKPCGASFIAQNKTCLIGNNQQKIRDFANCTDAWENGVMDIPRSSLAYTDKLDRDHDGIACEVSDMYDGNTWVYGIEGEMTQNSPQAVVSSTSVQLSCTGLKNIPKSSEFYHVELDRDGDGYACGSSSDDDVFGVPVTTSTDVAPTHGVLYVAARELSPIGSVSYYGDGKVGLFIGSQNLTFQAGHISTIEGQKLEAAPYFVSDKNTLMVPLSATRLADCVTTLLPQGFSIICKDGTQMTGVATRY